MVPDPRHGRICEESQTIRPPGISGDPVGRDFVAPFKHLWGDPLDVRLTSIVQFMLRIRTDSTPLEVFRQLAMFVSLCMVIVGLP